MRHARGPVRVQGPGRERDHRAAQPAASADRVRFRVGESASSEQVIPFAAVEAQGHGERDLSGQVVHRERFRTTLHLTADPGDLQQVPLAGLS